MDDDYKAVWDCYFRELVGWTLHPGYLRDNGKDKVSIAECADMADEMLEIRQHRFEDRT